MFVLWSVFVHFVFAVVALVVGSTSAVDCLERLVFEMTSYVCGVMKLGRSILKTIWCRKHRWLGHVLRHDHLLHDIAKGKTLGKATHGRKGWSYCMI